MQLPFFLLLFLGLLYKQIWFVWFVKAVANAKNKRPCFLGQGLLLTTTSRYAATLIVSSTSTVALTVVRPERVFLGIAAVISRTRAIAALTSLIRSLIASEGFLPNS